jgi:hypothetical protein
MVLEIVELCAREEHPIKYLQHAYTGLREAWSGCQCQRQGGKDCVGEAREGWEEKKKAKLESEAIKVTVVVKRTFPQIYMVCMTSQGAETGWVR